MFYIQSKNLKPYPNENRIKYMTHSLYPGGLFFGINIIISMIIVFRLNEIPPLLKVQLLVLPPHIMHVRAQLNQIIMQNLAVLQI